jgi:hypothetical protein
MGTAAAPTAGGDLRSAISGAPLDPAQPGRVSFCLEDLMGQSSIRCSATWASYSDAYRADLKRAIARVEADHKAGLPTERLVVRARAAYAMAWHNELRRTATC